MSLLSFDNTGRLIASNEYRDEQYKAMFGNTYDERVRTNAIVDRMLELARQNPEGMSLQSLIKDTELAQLGLGNDENKWREFISQHDDIFGESPIDENGNIVFDDALIGRLERASSFRAAYRDLSLENWDRGYEIWQGLGKDENGLPALGDLQAAFANPDQQLYLEAFFENVEGGSEILQKLASGAEI